MSPIQAATTAAAVCALALVAACDSSSDNGSDDTEATEPTEQSSPETAMVVEDLSDALFAPDHLIEVEVEIAEDDWDTLRGEGRKIIETLTGCGEDLEYTYFEATVTVDGERYERVAVRKKGFLGSLSTLRPSLKLNFGRLVEGRTHADMKRMTLNNNFSDASNVHQCMSYALFTAAGVVAPRCNFARVTVNGEDLGIYTHVESVKKPMLRRHFADDDGNLYEGQGADFDPETVDRMELKTNEQENDRSDLDRVIAALAVEDDELLDALGEVIDVDNFLSFWAMEVITAHWDGYSGGSNNYLTYHDPTSDRFFFIPWGTDNAFSGLRIFSGDNTNPAVLAQSSVANRLYEHPEGQELYFERLRQLMDEHWDTDALLAETERIGELTGSPEGPLQAHRDFLPSHASALLEALDAEAPEWTNSGTSEVLEMCDDRSIEVSGTFATTWGSQAAAQLGQTVNLDFGSLPWDSETLRASAGLSDEDPRSADILFLNFQPSGAIRVLIVRVPTALMEVGEIPMHAFETTLFLVDLEGPFGGGEPKVVGLGGGGTLTFTAVGTEPGDPVEGSFEGRLIQIREVD